ncbi:MAG TPA: hypothetical protein VGD98_03245 [Ktedonobacteraceae bacterium]
METILEGHLQEESHLLKPIVKARRARAGVLMLIIADVLSVFAIMAAGGYLSILNTENQFKIAGDFAPALTPGLLVALAIVLSGMLYFLWYRTMFRSGGNGQTFLFWLAWLLMLAAGVGETWLGASLKYGVPISAYESILLLITWFTAVHLLLSAFVGLLFGGRILRNRVRIDGLAFVPEVVGYWWYYTIIASLLMWVFGVFFT